MKKTFGEISKNVFKNTNVSKNESEENSRTIDVIEEYKLVKQIIEDGYKLIFVTGGAGTGKSTFVEWLYEEFNGEIVLSAPTGIAAVNISGRTLHSLCKFPPAWIVNDDIKKDGKSVLTRAKILVIDEISMVNANLLDNVDNYLRLNRKNNEPFGGLTLILVGDLFQLPPIVTKETKKLFDIYYDSAKFFAAGVLEEISPIVVELDKVFRQTDQVFIDLLNKIREGASIKQTLEVINNNCLIISSPPVGSVALAPRNVDVEQINSQALNSLEGESIDFNGVISGSFKENSLPAPLHLSLKVGAQVVLLNNTKEWINGSVGIVRKIYENKIDVALVHSGKVVEVVKHTWKQFDYQFDEEKGRIERTEVGSYEQIPVLLSWAMTIHKSQGMTLDRVHLHLGAGAFEYGQTYVAISRCRSFEGLSLSRPIEIGDIKVDPETQEFYSQIRENLEEIEIDE